MAARRLLVTCLLAFGCAQAAEEVEEEMSQARREMIEETRAFFRELPDQDLGVRNVISSDFAMLNERLAEHYGIEGVDGPKLRRVSIPKESVRGGFLSQASVHKVSANGTNTSPVVRGVWVTERILGKHAPPPPPGVIST